MPRTSRSRAAAKPKRSPSPESEPKPKRSRGEPAGDDSRIRAKPGLGEESAGRKKTLSDKAFLSTNKALQAVGAKSKASQLKVTSVDLCASQNREKHHTDEFEIENLIVRRGQTFEVKVTFDRKFNDKNDVIVLQFVVGNRPQESKGSLIRVVVKDDLTTSGWGMKIKSSDGNTVCLTVMSSAKAFIGKYNLFVETRTKTGDAGDQLESRYKHDQQIIVLFNAWCKDDAVFMEKEDERQEYVMNDSGYIWVGTHRSYEGIPWNFGQFDEVVLDAALYLLESAKLPPQARSSPVRVIRCMSAMANFNDDDGGILYGRWTETYPKSSTPPTAWTGSVKIIEQFMEKKRDVKYGQCWVFSGLVTSLLRALGIPTRSVTNFESAHDSDSSMTIDFHFDKDGNPMEDLDDSIWNFHVWNESWFKRPDLPDGHDGWQALDATPQETSEGVFCCGPASVNAVKNGEVYLPYDTSFVFAEVNGDLVYWDVKEDGSMDPYYNDKGSIGKNISTKAVGTRFRQDVTSHYKHPEGSAAERRAVEFANKFSSRADENIYREANDDVTFSLDVIDDIKIGDAFDVTVNMTNKSTSRRTVKITISSKLAYYTGVPAGDCRGKATEVDLPGKGKGSAVLSIKKEDYIKKIAADGGIKIYIKAQVKETRQAFAKQDVVEFKKPALTLEVSNTSPGVREEVEVKLSFKNPLPVKLTGTEFHLEGSYMGPKAPVIPCKSVAPGAQAQASVTMMAYRSGQRQLVASFQAHQLSGVRGEATLTVSRK